MRKLRLRTAAAFFAAVLLYPTLALGISAESAIIMDAQTGRVLYEKNADTRSLIASTTKMMTALIVCEQCNVLDRMRIPQEAVGAEGSSMYLQSGEVLTIQELLYGLMLSSGNDAAIALAIYCAGTVEGFVQLMNDKARYLQLENTHFANPHGLDAKNHYSTARDLAKIAKYAMQNSVFAQTVATKSVRITGRSLQNHNKLLWQCEGADGVKTGYTKAAGRILVSTVTRQARRLICVTINDRNDWADHTALYEDAFSRFSVSEIVKTGDCMGSLCVLGGTKETVQLYAQEDFSYPLALEERVSFALPGKDFVFAPTVRGADAGFAYICIDGKPVAKVRVAYAETIEQSVPDKKPFWQRKFFGGANT